MKGVTLTPLKQIADERGKIMHMMRATDPHFSEFGEVYFSWINPGIVKGWHKHSVTTVNLAVPVGKAKIVVRDPDAENQCMEFVLSQDNYQLLSIEPGLWYGFSCEGSEPTMITNCASHPHDPDESEKCDIDAFNYSWTK